LLNDASIQELKTLLDKDNFDELYAIADQVRKEHKGDIVNIRAILEFSNYCRKNCIYCGLNSHNSKLPRFRMMPEEMIHTAYQAHAAGYETIILQSGEDPYFTPQLLGEIVKEIKKTNITVTLSCGEMSYDDYAYLKECGADRYLLKHETANEALYAELHPGESLQHHLDCLRNIKKLGYGTGSGFMIGLPGQTTETIAKDILLLKELGCDMAGIGPFISNPDTPLQGYADGSPEMTKRAVALARIIMSNIDLPATTALGVLDLTAKNDVFSTGANVIMKKVTPNQYKKFYEIYPSQLTDTDIQKDRTELEKYIIKLGRIPV
jgi:biotin synthase